jgi:hypothetical protein
MPGRLTRVFGEVRRADVSNVTVGANQNPRAFGGNELCRVTTAQMIEEPGAIVEPGIRHAIAGA